MKISSSTYDKLKFVALIVLPALAAFYLGFGNLWEFPETEKVATSIMLVDGLLGALLQIDNARFKKDPQRLDGYLGSTGVDPDTGIPDLQLVVTTDPRELVKSKNAILKIGLPPAS